jgi:hypothetical protein
MFRQVEDVRAIRKQGRVPGGQVEPPQVELSERRDQIRGGVPLTLCERLDLCE